MHAAQPCGVLLAAMQLQAAEGDERRRVAEKVLSLSHKVTWSDELNQFVPHNARRQIALHEHNYWYWRDFPAAAVAEKPAGEVDPVASEAAINKEVDLALGNSDLDPAARAKIKKKSADLPYNQVHPVACVRAVVAGSGASC